jgi:hypothetical protein
MSRAARLQQRALLPSVLRMQRLRRSLRVVGAIQEREARGPRLFHPAHHLR